MSSNTVDCYHDDVAYRSVAGVAYVMCCECHGRQTTEQLQRDANGDAVKPFVYRQHWCADCNGRGWMRCPYCNGTGQVTRAQWEERHAH
jgi:DnaJ-class molecular chaperone